MSQRRIICDPVELAFEDVEPGKKYERSITLTNCALTFVELVLKPGLTMGREYTLSVYELTLRPKESAIVKVSFTTSKEGNFRDVIHMTAATFTEKFYINVRGFQPESSHFQSLVKDKDEQLQSSQSRIDRLEEEIEELSEKLRIATSKLNEKARIEQEFVRVQQENSELRAQVEELKKSDSYNQQFKDMLNQSIPSLESLIELTLKQERDRQERKNEKVLEILQIKDSLIEDLEEKNEELTNALTLMQHQLNDTKVLLNNTEKSLQEYQKKIEDLKMANFEKDQALSGFKGKSFTQLNISSEEQTAAKSDQLKNYEHIKNLTETLQKYEQENIKLREREEYVLEMSNRHNKIKEDHDKTLKDKDTQITSLKAKVQTQSEHIESLALKLSQINYSDILTKMSTLEEENKCLSKKLAESQLSSQSMRKEDLYELSTHRVHELETENERLASSLKETTDKAYQLENLVSQKNREIISLQNDIIDHKKFKSEIVIKAAPSPEEELARLSSSLKEEQNKALKIEEENNNLKMIVKNLEASNKVLNNEISTLFDKIDTPEAVRYSSENQLITKINAKINVLKTKEQEALKAASLAEEGLRVLQADMSAEQNTEMTKELKKLQNELMQARSKNDVLMSSNFKLKEELEEKKQLIMSMQFLAFTEEKSSMKKVKNKKKLPGKLVKALLTAKIAESEAVKKLKQAGKFELQLRDTLSKKEEKIKSLEKELKLGKRRGSQESSSEPSSSSEIYLAKRVRDLEIDLNDIRESELYSWANYLPLSIKWKDEPTKTTDDWELLMDGLLYLVDQLAYPDNEVSTDTVEKAQRLVIRYLCKITSGEEKNPKSIAFRPSRDEDRKLWYVELLESQLGITYDMFKAISEISAKLGDVGGNFNSVASLKAVSIELVKTAKESIEGINVLQQLCMIIKADCESLVGGDIKQKTESLKRTVEDEVTRQTSQKSKEIQILLTENQKLTQEFSSLQEKVEALITESRNLQYALSQNKSKVSKLEGEKEELQRGIESLCQEIKETTILKDQALQRVDKLHEEMQDWQAEQVEILTSRERTILELQSQLKILREEKITTPVQESKPNTAELEKALEEIQELQDINEKIAKELFEAKKAHVEERSQLVAKIAELEENTIYAEKAEEFKGNMTGTLKKDPGIQITSLQVLLREKITKLDEEMRKRIDAENKLRNLVLTESSAEQKVNQLYLELQEKIINLELEVAKYEQSLGKAMNEKEELIDKCAEVTQALKETTENMRRVERDFVALQQDSKSEVIKLTGKLQGSANITGELKGKIKELMDGNARLQTENDALHVHLKSLEKEFESTSIRLEDSEKINTALKLKLKEFEQKIEDLEELRAIETNGHCDKLEALREEARSSFEEFEKAIEQYDGQISSLKDQYYNDIRQRKNPKKAAESVDFMLQIAKKDSIIKSLKSELKSVKPKKLDKKPKKPESPQKQEEIVSLQNQIYKLKAQNRNLECQLSSSKEELEHLNSELESKPTLEISSKKEISDIEKRHRSDMQKLAEEVARLREKWHSPEEWAQLINQNRDLELTVKKLNDELSRKKEILDNLKAQKDQQDYENNAIQEELEQIKDSSEKVKKLRLDISRKEKSIYEMKGIIEGLKENERKLNDENAQLAEKNKALRNDVARKESLIKEFKNRIESSSVESARMVSDECEKLKEKMKRLKADVERKDMQIKTMKTKLETTEIELEALQTDKQNISIDAFSNLEKEIKRNDKLQGALKKTEAQFHALCNITRRIFKELSDSVEFLKSKAGQNVEHELYSDCMDILNMDMKDLSEFVGHRSIGTNLCRIERLLEQGEDMGEIIEIFKKLLDERLELEKSSGNKKASTERSIKSKNSQGSFKSLKY